MTKRGCCFERPNFIIANRKSEKRTANSHRGRMVIIGSGLVAVGSCWCRKVVAGVGLVVAGAELVVAGICWCRKVVAGSGLVVAGAELVAAGAGRWSLLQEGGHRSRAGSSGAELVAAGAGRWSLLPEGGCRSRTGSCFCGEVVAGAGVVIASTGK